MDGDNSKLKLQIVKSSAVLLHTADINGNPICSMYGVFAHIWATFGVDKGKYFIHGASGNIEVISLAHKAVINHRRSGMQPWEVPLLNK